MCTRLEVLWCGGSLVEPFGTFRYKAVLNFYVCCVCLFVSMTPQQGKPAEHSQLTLRLRLVLPLLVSFL